MEIQQKLLLGFIFVLLLGALFLVFSSSTPSPPPQNGTKNETVLSDEEKLLYSSINFGYDLTNYNYSFDEYSQTYKVHYNVLKNGDEGLVSIDNPLSTKQIFLYQNDVAICIKYNADVFTCSSAFNKNLSTSNLQAVNDYIWNLRTRFFNNGRIQTDKDNVKFLLTGKYLAFSGPIVQTQINGKSCNQLNYTIDYSSMPQSDAQRFGITSASPKIFNLSVCMVGDMLVERTISYQLSNATYSNSVTPLSLNVGAPVLPPFPKLTSGPDSINILFQEKQYQAKFATCFANTDAQEKEQCLLVLSRELQNPALCDLTPNSKDFCLYRLAGPDTVYLCSQIQGQNYHDKCYYTVSLVSRNASLCTNIINASMVTDCQQTIKNNPGLNSSTVVNIFGS